MTLRELYTRYAPPGEAPPSEADLRRAMAILDDDPRAGADRRAKLAAYLRDEGLTEIAAEYGVSRQAMTTTIRLAVLAIRKHVLGLPHYHVVGRAGRKASCACGKCERCRRRAKQARWRAKG